VRVLPGNNNKKRTLPLLAEKINRLRFLFRKLSIETREQMHLEVQGVRPLSQQGAAMRKSCLSVAALVLASVSALPASAEPPSFNCAKATYADERTICSSAELSQLDNVADDGYEYVRRVYGDQYANSITVPFLHARRACAADVACIKESQLAAIKKFQSLGARINALPAAPPTPAASSPPGTSRISAPPTTEAPQQPKVAAGPSGVAKAAAGEGLVIAIIDSHLEANPLCEGGPRVCRSGRFLMIDILNMSNETFDKATLVCSVFDENGQHLIETVSQKIPGPIFPRQVNSARG
jgi:hypothetical protein